MKRPSSPGPRYRADTHVDIDPPLSLRDIVEALDAQALADARPITRSLAARVLDNPGE